MSQLNNGFCPNPDVKIPLETRKSLTGSGAFSEQVVAVPVAKDVAAPMTEKSMVSIEQNFPDLEERGIAECSF